MRGTSEKRTELDDRIAPMSRGETLKIRRNTLNRWDGPVGVERRTRRIGEEVTHVRHEAAAEFVRAEDGRVAPPDERIASGRLPLPRWLAVNQGLPAVLRSPPLTPAATPLAVLFSGPPTLASSPLGVRPTWNNGL